MGAKSLSQLLTTLDTERLAREVHGAWRDGMLAQNRSVGTGRDHWTSLPEKDKALDRSIALRLVGLIAAMVEAADLPIAMTEASDR